MSLRLIEEQRRIIQNLEHHFMHSRTRIWPINPDSDLQNLEWVVFEPRIFASTPSSSIALVPSVDTLNEEFECPICMNTIIPQTEHFRTECGHQFCWACIDNLNLYMQDNQTSTKCPMCRKTIVSRNP